MSVKNSSLKERPFHIDERILKHKEGSEAQVSAADAIIGDSTAAGGNADIWKTHIWSHLRIFMAWTKKHVSLWNRKGKRLRAFTARYWGLYLQTRRTLSDLAAWKLFRWKNKPRTSPPSIDQCEREPAVKQQVLARLVAPMTTWTLNVSNRFITEWWTHFMLLILRIWTFAEPENAIQIELEFRRLTFARLISRITQDFPSTHSCRTQRVKQMGKKALARERGPEETLATNIYSDVKLGTILSPNISRVIYFPSICSWMRCSVEWSPRNNLPPVNFNFCRLMCLHWGIFKKNSQ